MNVDAVAEVAEDLSAPVQGMRVLVVDDCDDGAQCVCDVMHSLGHQACWARDGRSAIKILETFDPDVVILDIGLPDMTGYDVAAAIRIAAKGRPIRIVALTGWGRDEDRARSGEAGIDEHLLKPVTMRTLQSALV